MNAVQRWGILPTEITRFICHIGISKYKSADFGDSWRFWGAFFLEYSLVWLPRYDKSLDWAANFAQMLGVNQDDGFKEAVRFSMTGKGFWQHRSRWKGWWRFGATWNVYFASYLVSIACKTGIRQQRIFMFDIPQSIGFRHVSHFPLRKNFHGILMYLVVRFHCFFLWRSQGVLQLRFVFDAPRGSRRCTRHGAIFVSSYVEHLSGTILD